MSEWKLMWNDSPGFEDHIIFREIDEGNNNAVITEFSLTPPRHAKLYYALKDWFND